MNISAAMREYPENLMLTGMAMAHRSDVVAAFDGSGYEVIPQSIRFPKLDPGWATCLAGVDGGEYEPWVVMPWGTMGDGDKASWMHGWSKDT